MSVINSIPLIAAGDDGYQISRSVRLRSSASAYLNRTPASAGNRKTWTWSDWVKRGTLGTRNIVIQAEAGGNTNAVVEFNSSDQLRFFQQVGGVDTFYLTTTQVFRDPSAWYHLMVVLDTTQATSTNRMKIYVNGVQITSFSSSLYPSQNFDGSFNNTVAQYIGTWLGVPAYFDGYHTEINFIDGQALTPSSFGETDTTTGVWKPKKYAGTYGTNGFYLNFSDNSAATAAAIGKDYSGNGNNWTPNNISVTAGATYDSMLDVPTMWADGGNGRGNYCVLNPLQPASTTVVVPTDGNLKMTGTASGNNVTGTIAIVVATYFEGTAITGGGTLQYGIKNLDTGNTYAYDSSGNKSLAGSSTAYGATFTTNDIIGVAVDPVNLTLQFYKNGTSQGVISSAFPAGNYVPFFYASNTNASAANFGQRPFTYTPPTSFKALNTQNLPTPTISNGANYMAASTYTGTGATQSIVNSGNNAAGISFQPDFVWIKDRSAARSHRLFDAVRGATKALFSDATDAETTLATDLTAFNSNGFTLGAGAGSNSNTETFVGWQWKASGSTVSNTSGSITSTVSAGATQGFSVVTFAGASTQGATVGHGLGVAPKMVIAKNRTTTQNWWVYHVSLGYANNIILNSTGAAAADANTWRATPSSTVITIGDNFATGSNYVAYCFAEVAGYSKFGSYTGNGSADGPFVYCGFRPRFILFKSSTYVGSFWNILDTSRDTYNVAQERLYPNSSAASQNTSVVDILSNGFKARSANSDFNQSGETYIFAAFAENPFKNSLAR